MAKINERLVMPPVKIIGRCKELKILDKISGSISPTITSPSVAFSCFQVQAKIF